MAEIKVEPVSSSGIQMKAEGTTVFISGSINHPRPGEFMEPFIQKTHESIIENNIMEVKVDITKLKFLNSRRSEVIVKFQ